MRPIRFARIGNVKGKVVLAFGILGIDSIDAFGRFVVTLLGLWADGIASEGDTVGLKELIALIERHDALGLEHNDAIGVRWGVAAC